MKCIHARDASWKTDKWDEMMSGVCSKIIYSSGGWKEKSKFEHVDNSWSIVSLFNSHCYLGLDWKISIIKYYSEFSRTKPLGIPFLDSRTSRQSRVWAGRVPTILIAGQESSVLLEAGIIRCLLGTVVSAPWIHMQKPSPPVPPNVSGEIGLLKRWLSYKEPIRWVLIISDWGPCKKSFRHSRWHKGIYTCKRPCAPNRETGFRSIQICQHLDLGIPASRAMKTQTLACGICCDKPVKLICVLKQGPDWIWASDKTERHFPAWDSEDKVPAPPLMRKAMHVSGSPALISTGLCSGGWEEKWYKEDRRAPSQYRGNPKVFLWSPSGM